MASRFVRPFQSHSQIASRARRFIPEDHTWLVMMNDDEVDVTVRIKIGGG